MARVRQYGYHDPVQAEPLGYLEAGEDVGARRNAYQKTGLSGQSRGGVSRLLVDQVTPEELLSLLTG